MMARTIPRPYHNLETSLIILFLLLIIGLLAMTSVRASEDTEVDDETCLACHDPSYGDSLEKTSHALASMTPSAGVKINCVSCHSGASVHIEDPNTENIGNPSTMLPEQVEKTCTQCHQPHTESGVLGFDPHIGLNLACVECHSIHSKDLTQVADESSGLCGKCHAAAVNEFRKRSNHPVATGNMSCLSCHSFRQDAEPQFGHGGDAQCYSCHPEQSGPFLFEHEATSSFSPEGSGCTSCHRPHGSSNDRLLTQTDDKLCRQCHAQPPGHLTAHSGEFAGLNCMDCHSEVHGSYDNLFLLDPQLGSKLRGDGQSCFCHEYR